MRTQKTIRNSNYGIAYQSINIIIKFALQTVFIKTLGADYLGINGLYTNILQMLSLAELGVGEAIVYHLYRPIAVNDTEQIKALMSFYRRAYNTIGFIILAAGLLLTPFLKFIITNPPDIPDLVVFYWLFLANTVISYFFSYKRSIITADQNAYINTQNQLVRSIIQTVLQVIVLVFFHNYYLYLIIMVLCTLGSNIAISRKANRLYPYLVNNRSGISPKEKKSILRDVYAMTAHKVGNVIVNGTDNILLSMFVGITEVGIYSNYVLIKSALSSLLNQFFSAMTASVGNMNVLESKEKSYSIYLSSLLANFWLYGFTSIGFFICVNPLIIVWAGKDYLLSVPLVFLITVNYYISGVRATTLTFRDTLGLFWNDRHKPYFEAAINLAASLYFLKYYGFVGILIGTFISTITTCFWVEPYVLYKYGFHKPVSGYFLRYLIYTIIIAAAGAVTFWICSFIAFNGWQGLIIRVLVCCIIPNAIFYVLARPLPEFQYLYRTVLYILYRKKG